ncbi:MAG: DUF5683 domain-containing protein [Cyclobacteriaceae bacterium]|nr:DUF5683 domain-containing protein [Cyclobacteriaceae bacterium]
MKFSFTVSLLLLLFATFSYSQEQTTEENNATTVSTEEKNLSDTLSFPNIPRKAFLFSAVFPGLGQALNGKYWKIPIVYSGFIFLSWQIERNNSAYLMRKKQLLQAPDVPLPPQLSEERLRNLIDKYRRERDYMIIWTAGFYMLQIVDAHIDAHLRDFDLNPDLQVKIGPSVEPLMTSGLAGGMGITLTF